MDGYKGCNMDGYPRYEYQFGDLSLSIIMDVTHPFSPAIRQVAVCSGNHLLRPKQIGLAHHQWVVDLFRTTNVIEHIHLSQLIDLAVFLAERADMDYLPSAFQCDFMHTRSPRM